MVYLFKDFYTNFSGAVVNNDKAAQQDILISELADLIIADKPNLLGVLQSASSTTDPGTQKGGRGLANVAQKSSVNSLTSTSSHKKFAEALAKHLPNNPELQKQVAVLIAHRQGLLKKKATMTSAAEGAPMDPVSAIAAGIGSIFNFGASFNEKKAAEEQRLQQEDNNRTAIMAAIINKTGQKETSYTGLYIVGGVILVAGLAILLLRSNKKK